MNATFFKPSELRQRASKAVIALSNETAHASLDERIDEAERRITYTQFDAFLSYSSLDWVVVYGLYLALTDRGLSVYVDRIKDPQLDRRDVTVATAEVLRARMRQCRSLLFATTDNISHSKWLPWEVGYFDGYRGKVAIVPINETGSFTGQEYLGLYPVLESDDWLKTPDGRLMTKFKTWLGN